jgi:anti-sigma regulatory factor (Ser/Thr protein kinase)
MEGREGALPEAARPNFMTRSGTRSGEESLSLRLDGGIGAAASARSALGRLRADIDPPLMETLRLLVTELVTNSVKHASAEAVSLRVLVGRQAVLVEVTDHGPGFQHRPRRRNDARDSGWGLFLVERLANRWGVGNDGPATRVWFELRRG